MKIRHALLLTVLLTRPWCIHAQTAYGLADTSQAGMTRTVNNLKTGNTLDVLTSFFQLALQDLGGRDKSFAFKSTLFGMKARADSTLLVDTEFRRQRASRNLQFEVALHTNDNFKPVGIGGGVTYALVNNRDKKRADFRNTDFEKALDALQAAKRNAEGGYRQLLRDSLNNIVLPAIDADSARLKAAQDEAARNALLEDLDSLHAVKRELVSMRAAFNKITNGSADAPDALQKAYARNKLPELRKAANDAYDSLMENIAARGLLTLSLTARTDSNTSRFNEGSLELIYLKGLSGKRRVEADVRVRLHGKDTLTPDNGYRYQASALAGANIIVFQSRRTHKSLFEVKPNLEFRSILSKQYPEQENYFSFNMDLRLRITDQIWIPLIVKYDPEHQNFLGVLNVSANFDALKGLLGSN